MITVLAPTTCCRPRGQRDLPRRWVSMTFSRSSLIKISEQGANTLGEVAAVLADAEALEAHGLSAQKRMRGGD